MRAARLFTQAQRLTAQDRLDEALAIFDQLVAARSPSVGVYLHWALALSEASRLEAAVEAMHQAMALEPDNAVIPMFLGQILFDHEQYAEARIWCNQALDRNPQQRRASALVGLIDLASGDIATGYQHLQHSQSPSLTRSEQIAQWCRIKPPPTLAQQSSTLWQSRLLLVVETTLLKHPTARTLAAQLVEPESESVNIIDRVLTRSIMMIQRSFYRLRYATDAATRGHRLRYIQAEEAYYLNQFKTATAIYHQLSSDLPDQHIDHRLYEIASIQGNFHLALTHWQRYLHANGSPREISGEEALILAELQIQDRDISGASVTLEHAETMQWKDYRLPYYQGLCQLHTDTTRTARRSFAEAASRLHPDIATLRLNELYRTTQSLSDPSPSDPHTHSLHVEPPPTSRLPQG